ncbi:MAG: hypothetical protein QM767_14205 [Anaeromyxobacter sp.]
MQHHANRWAALLLIILAGCASRASGPRLSSLPALEPAPGKTLLYVYRQRAEPVGSVPTVRLDGQALVELRDGGFTRVLVAPGERRLTVQWPSGSGQKDIATTVELVAGQTVFVDVSGTVRVTGTERTEVYMLVDNGSRWAPRYQYTPQMTASSSAKVVNPADAEAIVTACCRFQAPLADAF